MQPSYGRAYRDRLWQPTVYSSVESRNSVHVNRSSSEAVLWVRCLSLAVQHCLGVCRQPVTLIGQPLEVSVRCLMSVAVVRTSRHRCALAARLQCQAARS